MKVIELGPHPRMTVDQALEFSRRESAEYSEVMILAWDQDGALVVRSSHMSGGSALWMIEHAKKWVLSRGEE